jgi:vanillate O-demethylase monooxygenase subunit
MFVRNAWYVVAWDYEVLTDTILERTVLGESVIVYRAGNGSPIVMENRCCHRGAPLAQGRKEGDCIRCMYHGLKFDPSGACIEIPGQEKIPDIAKVRTYPAVQRTRWIWVWMGERALADEKLIPDTFSITHPAWRTKPGYKLFSANFLFLTDNLLDFSHLSYVHETTLGGSKAIAEAAPEVTSQGGNGVRIVRRLNDTDPAPYHLKFGHFPGKVDRWWEYTLNLSGMFIMSSGVQSVEKRGDDAQGALLFHSCQALTPQSADSTHYFFSHAHNFSLDDPTVTESIYQSIVQGFDEDRRIIEAQRQVLDRDPDRSMVATVADRALLLYRRMVKSAVAAEQTSRAQHLEATSLQSTQ